MQKTNQTLNNNNISPYINNNTKKSLFVLNDLLIGLFLYIIREARRRKTIFQYFIVVEFLIIYL